MVDLIDFTVINNNIEVKTDFYPSYLNLNKTNINPSKINYLNLKANAIDNPCIL